MNYKATEDSSTQTPEERIAEAQRILFEIRLVDHLLGMEPREFKFVRKMQESLSRTSIQGQFVSIKQLWWLRDLKDKYCV